MHHVRSAFAVPPTTKLLKPEPTEPCGMSSKYGDVNSVATNCSSPFISFPCLYNPSAGVSTTTYKPSIC